VSEGYQSGFYRRGQFTLSHEQLQKWHATRCREGCRFGNVEVTLPSAFRHHLRPKGFRNVHAEAVAGKVVYLVLEGPGLAECDTRLLWEALTGVRGKEMVWTPKYPGYVDPLTHPGPTELELDDEGGVVGVVSRGSVVRGPRPESRFGPGASRKRRG